MRFTHAATTTTDRGSARWWRRGGALVALAALLVGGAAAQPAAAADTATVTFVVVDDHGDPIRDFSSSYGTPGGTSRSFGTSNASGVTTVVLPVGDYTISTGGTFVDGTNEFDYPRWIGGDLEVDATLHTLTAGQVLDLGTLVRHPRGIATGRLTDEFGDPIPNFPISIWPAYEDADGDLTYAGLDWPVSTDANGDFRIKIRELGSRIVFSPYSGAVWAAAGVGGGVWTDDGPPLVVPPGTTQTDVDVVLQGAASIRVAATYADGTAVTDAVAIVEKQRPGDAWGAVGQEPTDADGVAVVDGVGGGAYRVSLEVSGQPRRYLGGGIDPASAELLEPTSDAVLDAAFTIGRPRSLSGTVTTAVPHAGSIIATLYQRSGPDWLTLASDIVDETTGRYGFADLVDGTYVVAVQPYGSHVQVAPAFVGGAGFADATRYVVADGVEHIGADVELAVGGSVTGVLLKGGSGFGNVDVQAIRVGGDDYFQYQPVLTGLVDTVWGGYRITGLAPGTYRVRVGYGTSDAPTVWNGGGDWAESAPLITVTAGAETVVPDIETGYPVRVRGHIAYEGAEPTEAVEVRLYRRDTAKPGQPWRLLHSTTTTPGSPYGGGYYEFADVHGGGPVIVQAVSPTRGELFSGGALTFAQAAGYGAPSSVTVEVDTIDFAAAASEANPGLAPKYNTTPRVGRKIWAQTTGWAPGTALEYQWSIDGVPVWHGTTNSFTLVGGHLGKRLQVTVTARAPGTPVIVRSSPAFTVQPGLMTATPTPKIVGSRGSSVRITSQKVGKTLHLSVGRWDAGVRLSYRWYRDGRMISGATGTTYKLRSSDRGHRVQVRVTGSKTHFVTVSRTSSAVRATSR